MGRGAQGDSSHKIGCCWDVHTSSEVRRGSLGERKNRDAGAESQWGQSRLPAGGESVPRADVKKEEGGVSRWLSHLSVHFSSGHDFTIHEFEPRVRLCADSSEPRACLGFCVSLFLSASLSFSLSLKNKHLKKKRREFINDYRAEDLEVRTRVHCVYWLLFL